MVGKASALISLSNCEEASILIDRALEINPNNTDAITKRNILHQYPC
jgi:hypothetical protein